MKKSTGGKRSTAKRGTAKRATVKRAPKKTLGKKSDPASVAAPARAIDQRIRELDDWRGETLARLRALILEADPGIVEEWKWNVPVWSCDGIICTGESYQSTVKLTFAHGAALPDPAKLFNSSLEGKTRRAIDVRAGDSIDEKAFKALIQAAARFNRQGA